MVSTKIITYCFYVESQFVRSELGRGAIQGVSQYISKKMREEKVHLKSGYGLMLYQNNNQ